MVTLRTLALAGGAIRCLPGSGRWKRITDKPLKKFFPYYRHLWMVKGQFALGVTAGLIYAAASGAGLPLMTKVVFPVLFNENVDQSKWYVAWLTSRIGEISRQDLLIYTCLWIPAVFLVRAIAGYTNAYFIQHAGMRVVESIRTDLFVKLQQLPLAFFKRNKSGDLLARLMNDTQMLQQVIAQASSDLIKQPATLLFALATVGYLAFKDRSSFIALIALLTVPLCILLIRSAGKKLTRRARALQEKGGDLSASLSESLQSALEIRAYNLQEMQVSRFRSRIAEIFRLGMKVVKYRQIISPSIEVVAATGFAAALYFGVRAGMTLEGFLALGMALYMSYEPMKKLGNIHSLFQQGGASVDRIEFILHSDDTILEPEHPKPCPLPVRGITFKDVTFAYNELPVLHDVDLHIPAGQVVALVGPSGAGKSTFAHLVPRFYDPQAGEVQLDGVSIREFLKGDLRNHIAVVPQTPSLFLGTLEENIRIGKQDATREEIETAAKKAFAHDFISKLPNGYETSVGERGDLLSGGQRQRIAIARAFLKDAPILILDEATSALDTESEAMVQQALAELVKGRTTLIIAHRFSTIRIADRILVFKNGRIISDGSHDELRDIDPTYQAMMGGELR
ncbi:ABC transporter ATP-binding protein [Luteolibacter algae]|uniref:ABC transporter ATP-binding protein n=1 Tax=Luteolibacter algae TaxID=454151 RepID=A0ABW5D5I4_9BACT